MIEGTLLIFLLSLKLIEIHYDYPLRKKHKKPKCEYKFDNNPAINRDY